MRQFDAFYYDKASDLVAGTNATTPATITPFVKGDTLRIAARQVVDNPESFGDVLVAVPWDVVNMRASVGLIDAPPESGTFKLTVEDQETEAIIWPASFAEPDAVAKFKKKVLDALKALINVDDDAIVSSDPPGSPPHFIYLTWTDAEDDRPITVSFCGLAPLILPDVELQVPLPAYQQCIKLVQAPIAETTDFQLVEATQPTVIEDRAGAAGTPGVNAVQRLTVASGSTGSIVLTWSGAQTRLMTTPGLTAAQIATALNAVVPNGEIAPSFRVTDVPGAGGTFAVEFIGPLASAVQPLLAAHLYSSIPPTVAIATLPLTSPRFTRALNGALSVPVRFEFVRIDNLGYEATVIREVTLHADMTGPGTEQDLDDAGAVVIKEKTVYVDNEALTPIASIAPGGTFQPPSAVAAGVAINVEHSLNTRTPFVKIFYQDSLSPVRWRELTPNGDYGCEAVDENHVEITFPAEITDTPNDPTYRLRYKIFISSPDAVLTVYGNLYSTWDKVLDSLPDGQNVRAKFAELEARIGQLAGGVKIGPNSLDLDALIRAVLAALTTDLILQALFVDLIKTIITNREIINSILTTIQTDSTLFQTFIDLLIKTFAETRNIQSLVQALFKNTTFLEEFRSLVTEAFQRGGVLPEGLIVIAFADFEFIAPPPHQYAGPSSPVISGSKEVTITAGEKTTVVDSVTTTSGGQATKQTVPIVENVPGKRLAFELLPCELIAPTADATIAGTVKLGDITDGHTRTANAAVSVRTIGARRGADFPSGTILARKNGIIFPVRLDTGNAWPVEMEANFFSGQLDDGMLYPDSRFALNFVLQTQLAGNAQGRIDFRFVTGMFSHEGAETRDINAITWTAQLTRALPLTEATTLRSVAIGITRQTSVKIGTFTAATNDLLTCNGHGLLLDAKVRFASIGVLPAGLSVDTDYFVIASGLTANNLKVSATLGGAAIDITDTGTGTHTLFARDVRGGIIAIDGQQAATFIPPALPFTFRCELRNFDCENVAAGAKGSLIARVNSPACSIAKLT